jgi:hypothetical protein
MKNTYEFRTVRALKAAVFDAIDQGVVLSRGDTVSLEAFDMAVDAYLGMCRDAGRDVIAPAAVPAMRTRKAWLNELRAA